MSSQNNDQGNNQGALPMRLVSYAPKYFSTATSALVKTGAGTLGTIIVNTGGAGSTLTLYDGTSAAGTVMGVIDTSTRGFVAPNLSFATGLFAVTSGGTPANVTVGYL